MGSTAMKCLVIILLSACVFECLGEGGNCFSDDQSSNKDCEEDSRQNVYTSQPLVDCHPDPRPTQDVCDSRGCRWHEKSPIPGRPRCSFPEGHGYRLEGEPETTGSGVVFNLRRITSPTLFGADVETIVVKVEFQSDYRLRLKIYDPNRERYEVPLTTYSPRSGHGEHSRLYDVKWTNEPQFGITVVRRDTGTIVFDTRLPGTIFSEQFLQISTRLSSANVYGFGEHNHETFRHDMGWKRWVIFTKDIEVKHGHNLYGAQPFYTNVEPDGSTNGVFLKNSNAMEVFLQPDPIPSITFRTIGGIFDFYVFLGPTPENVVQQYTEAVGRPVMPPYWSLGFMLSRWGYNTSEFLRDVIVRNRQAGIPMDVQFGDIDYMFEKLDFTYDRQNFKDLPDIIQDLHSHGQKFIPIVVTYEFRRARAVMRPHTCPDYSRDIELSTRQGQAKRTRATSSRYSGRLSWKKKKILTKVSGKESCTILNSADTESKKSDEEDHCGGATKPENGFSSCWVLARKQLSESKESCENADQKYAGSNRKEDGETEKDGSKLSDGEKSRNNGVRWKLKPQQRRSSLVLPATTVMYKPPCKPGQVTTVHEDTPKRRTSQCPPYRSTSGTKVTNWAHKVTIFPKEKDNKNESETVDVKRKASNIQIPKPYIKRHSEPNLRPKPDISRHVKPRSKSSGNVFQTLPRDLSLSYLEKKLKASIIAKNRGDTKAQSAKCSTPSRSRSLDRPLSKSEESHLGSVDGSKPRRNSTPASMTYVEEREATLRSLRTTSFTAKQTILRRVSIANCLTYRDLRNKSEVFSQKAVSLISEPTHGNSQSNKSPSRDKRRPSCLVEKTTETFPLHMMMTTEDAVYGLAHALDVARRNQQLLDREKELCNSSSVPDPRFKRLEDALIKINRG